MDKIKVVIGSRIRRARRFDGMSQEKLAKKMRLSRASIANYEQGVQAVPITKLYEIAKHMGLLSLDFLLPSRPEIESEYKELQALSKKRDKIKASIEQSKCELKELKERRPEEGE